MKQFSADYESGEVITTEEGEILSLSEEEIKASELFPSVRQVIDHILNPDDETVFMTVTYDDSGNIITQESKKFLCGIQNLQ